MSSGSDLEVSRSNLSVNRQDRMLTFRLDAPGGQPVSQLAVMEELATWLEKVRRDASINVIVLNIGESGFDFGTDVEQVSGMSLAEAQRLSKLCSEVYGLLSSLDRPTIASISGECFGIGLELALHCDMRIACEGARFGLTGMNFGLVPNGMAVRRLTRLVGESHARMMALTGAVISADRAFVIGFVTNVLDTRDFEAGVNLLANHMVQMSPVAISETKKILDISFEDQVGSLPTWSARALARCITSDQVSDPDQGDTLLDLERADATIH